MKQDYFFFLLLLILPAVSRPILAACQPQCVAHARQSAKIFTHRVGNHRGAIDWFRLAQKYGHTRQWPGTGKIRLPLVLPPQRGLNPRFGHVVFVKNSDILEDGKTYLLKISHTNFDNACSHEQAQARLHTESMYLEFLDGFFTGKRFKVSGFITQ